MIIKWILGNEDQVRKSSILWNAIGGAFNACQSAILLIFISHKIDIYVAGMVTIAYAIANLYMAIAKYGVRNFQVTDVREKFKFEEYLYGRIFTVILSGLIAVVYLYFCLKFKDYSLQKIGICIEILVLKLIDAFEDVYLGGYQQKGRLDIGAKIMAVRLMISTALISLCICLNINIYISLMVGILCSVLLDIWFIRESVHVLKMVKGKEKKNIVELLKICFPLCVGSALSIYIGNAPKYMIDSYMDESVQAVFGYIMMPVFVIMLLSNFIYQPMVKELGELWEQKQWKAFKRKNLKQGLAILLLMTLVMVAGLTIGLPMLSVMYNINLMTYRLEFAMLLVGGGFYALAFYLNVPITTIRRQKYIAIGYVVAAIASVCFGKLFVCQWGIMGATSLYMCINLLLSMIYMIILAAAVRKEELNFVN